MPAKKTSRVHQELPVAVRVEARTEVPVHHEDRSAEHRSENGNPIVHLRSESKEPFVHRWTLEQRRKILVTGVSAIAILLLIGWGFVVRLEFRNNGHDPLISQVVDQFKSLSVSTAPAKPATNPQIQQLQQRVFPQFQNLP